MKIKISVFFLITFVLTSCVFDKSAAINITGITYIQDSSEVSPNAQINLVLYDDAYRIIKTTYADSQGKYIFSFDLEKKKQYAGLYLVAINNGIKSVTDYSSVVKTHVTINDAYDKKNVIDIVIPNSKTLKLHVINKNKNSSYSGITMVDYLTDYELEIKTIQDKYSQTLNGMDVDTILYLPIAADYTRAIQYRFIDNNLKESGNYSFSISDAQVLNNSDTLFYKFEY